MPNQNRKSARCTASANGFSQRCLASPSRGPAAFARFFARHGVANAKDGGRPSNPEEVHSLNLEFTLVTDAGLKWLKQALPGCYIYPP